MGYGMSVGQNDQEKSASMNWSLPPPCFAIPAFPLGHARQLVSGIHLGAFIGWIPAYHLRG